MATCPRCMGALTEHHRCPRGAFSRIVTSISTVGVGFAVGVVLCYAFVERPAGALVLAAAALGSVLVVALRQAIHS